MKIIIILLILLLIYMDIMNRDKYFDELLQYIPQNASVLDFGAGNCEFSKYIGNRNVTMSVDIHKSCEGADVYDGYKLPYEDNSFDVVLSMFVLHHIPHNQDIMKELQRVAREHIIIVEDMPVTTYQRLVARLHYLFFGQPMNTIKHMKTPQEWCELLDGNCQIKKIQSGSLINTTPHFVIVKDVSDTLPRTYHFHQ